METQTMQKISKREWRMILWKYMGVSDSHLDRVYTHLLRLKLIKKVGHRAPLELSWYDISLWIFCILCGKTDPAQLEQFMKHRLKTINDKQVCRGILDALMNPESVLMVYISERNVIVYREGQSLFFGTAAEDEQRNVPRYLARTNQVPGAVFVAIKKTIEEARARAYN